MKLNKLALALIVGVAGAGCSSEKTRNVSTGTSATPDTASKALSDTAPSAVHQALLGHWKEVASKAAAADPNYKGKVLSAKSTELYISPTSAWVVSPGVAPRQLSYSVSDVDAERFTLMQHVVAPTGERISSLVAFSQDLTEMRNTRVTETAVGSTSLTVVYLRIDEKTSPP
jgi:hypothetical protein